MTSPTAMVEHGPDVLHPVFSGRWSPEPRMTDGSRYPTMGYAAAAWIQAMCRLVLDPWQIEALRRLWLYHPDPPYDWVVRDMLIVGPEGLGKSAWFGGIGLWLLEGPCLPPAVRPRPHPMPDIPVVSAALSLTAHIHKFAKKYVKEGPLGPHDGGGRVTVENTRIFRADDTSHRLWFPAGSGAYQQGGGPTTIIEEELHVANEVGVKDDGVETIEVISSKRSKVAFPGAPKVQRLTITNPDDGDPESLLGRRWQHAQRVLDGEVEAPELLAIHFHALKPWNLDDPEDLRRGIRQAIPSSFADVEAIAAKYEVDRQSAGRFYRYSGGWFYAGADQVLPDGALEGRVRTEGQVSPPPDPGTERIALTFDGARNRDSVALYGFTEDGYGWTQAAWERPEQADDSWRYPKREIADAVVEAMETLYPDAILGVDPTWFEDFVFDGWGGEDGTWFPAWTERWPDRVVVGVQQQGSEAWSAYRRDVLDGAIEWDGDPRLVRHMRNAREKTNRDGKFPKLQKKRDDGKHPIDLLVTATYANRLRKNLPEPDEVFAFVVDSSDHPSEDRT